MPLEDLLKNVRADYKRRYKENTPEIKLGDEVPPATGLIVDNPLLEYILDRRFLAYGRCYLTYGKKGNSKTSLFFYLAKLFQENKGDVIWIETEKAADLDYARKQGVNTKRLVMPETSSFQEALTTVEMIIKNLPKSYPDGETPVLICLDSIAGGITDYEEAQNIGDYKIGEHARLMASFYRRICGPLSHEKAVFLALNQLKDKIGGMSFGPEPPEALIGGEAQRFHSTYQWKVDRLKDMVMAGENGAERKIGSKHQITGKRNKLGREGNSQKVPFDLYIKGGADWFSPLVRFLAENYKSPVSKTGGWYTWDIPNTYYRGQDADGHATDILIDTEKKFREAELGIIISQSTPAKEIIRTEFEIPDLPDPAIIKAIEEDNKKKRNKKKTSSEDDDNPIKEESL